MPMGIKTAPACFQRFIVETFNDFLQFLGNTICNGNIYPSKNRANAINKKPQPKLLNELQAWLGTANYLRRYIKDYAEITQPLYQMMDLKNVQKH